jgi:hypothetical protein
MNTTIDDGTPPQALKLARTFLDRLSAGDADGAVACLAADVVQDMPYSPPGFPKRITGRQTLHGLWSGVLGSVRSIEFTVLDLKPFRDPDWAMAEFTASMVQPSGREYRNHYFGFFHAVQGEVALYRELYDPLVFQTSVLPADRAAMFNTGQG